MKRVEMKVDMRVAVRSGIGRETATGGMEALKEAKTNG